MTAIEVGGGLKARDGWLNLDPVHGAGEWRRAAQDTPWPVGTGTVDHIIASHVMEHIPAGAERIAVMNEAHRVLAADGHFEIFVPLMVGTYHAIADPTHVSFWVEESFGYFDGTQGAAADYGILPWFTVSFETDWGWQGHWIGRPLK